MREAGLIDEWNKRFQPDARKCLLKSKNNRNSVKPLELRNLLGAFVVVAAGFLVSLIIFMAEKCLHRKFLHSELK
jgi:capsular polysaccharide biosynthesis protein